MLTAAETMRERDALAVMGEEEFIDTVSRWIFLAARSSSYCRYDALCGVAYEVNADAYGRAYRHAERLVR